MNLTITTYLLYLFISISLTVWGGYALFRNGSAFLNEIFNANKKLAESVNRLLLVGFYFLNIGYITLNMRFGMQIESAQHLIEKLSYKVGVILIILGIMHVFNLILLFRMRNQSKTSMNTRNPSVGMG